MPTNWDDYLAEHMKDLDFAADFKRAGEITDAEFAVWEIRKKYKLTLKEFARVLRQNLSFAEDPNPSSEEVAFDKSLGVDELPAKRRASRPRKLVPHNISDRVREEPAPYGERRKKTAPARQTKGVAVKKSRAT
ncbi:hypothetical protein BH09SUM1_BH09SUM1_33650 [soil metagenome]